MTVGNKILCHVSVPNNYPQDKMLVDKSILLNTISEFIFIILRSTMFCKKHSHVIRMPDKRLPKKVFYGEALSRWPEETPQRYPQSISEGFRHTTGITDIPLGSLTYHWDHWHTTGIIDIPLGSLTYHWDH